MAIHERYFSVSDSEFLLWASVMVKELPADIPKFMEFDTTITESLPAQIQSKIDVVMNIKSDSIVIDEQAEKTQILHDAIKNNKSLIRHLNFFVRKAFSDEPTIQNQFGFNDLKKARSSQANFILFLHNILHIAKEKQADLIAAGAPADLVDQLITAHNEVNTAYFEVERFKTTRKNLTLHRKESLNEIYSMVRPLKEIAMIIFEDDPLRIEIYTIPTYDKNTPLEQTYPEETTNDTPTDSEE